MIPIAIRKSPCLPALVLAVFSGCQAPDGLTGASPAIVPPRSPAAGARAAEAAPIDRTATRAEPVNDDPGQFIGQDAKTIAASLGTPDLVRREGPAEVRQFRGGACILDLFLYPDPGDSLTVRYVDLRGSGLDDPGRRACLADMIRDRTVAG